MNIEEFLELNDLLADEKNQYVIVHSKRCFLNRRSPLYSKPRFINNEDNKILINNETIIKNIENNKEFLKMKEAEKNIDSSVIEEIIIPSFMLKREKYDEIYKITKNYKEEIILETDILNELIRSGMEYNVVELTAFATKQKQNTNPNEKSEFTYGGTARPAFTDFNQLCKDIKLQGYDLIFEKEKACSINISDDDLNPYDKLCSLFLNSRALDEKSDQYDALKVVVKSSLTKNRKNTGLVKIRK